MNAAELDRYRSILGRPDCLISRIYGADFRVGTATTALTFERIGHREGARTMRLRALRLLAVLLSTALVAVGCGEDSAAPSGQNLTPLRVAMFPAGATLPVHAALTEGIFERNGLRIELTEGQDLPVFMAALAKGQYDIAQGVPTLVLIGAEKGLDLQVVSSVQRSSRERPNAVWITKDRLYRQGRAA